MLRFPVSICDCRVFDVELQMGKQIAWATLTRIEKSLTRRTCDRHSALTIMLLKSARWDSFGSLLACLRTGADASLSCALALPPRQLCRTVRSGVEFQWFPKLQHRQTSDSFSSS